MTFYSPTKQKTIAALLLTCAFVSGQAFAETKPFVAVIKTSEKIVPNETLDGLRNPAICPVLGKSSGEGDTNLFARSANVFTKVLLDATDCVSLQPVSATVFIPTHFDQGEFTLTANTALGSPTDSITARHEGTLTPNPDGTFTLNGTFTVIKGTGKYIKATGSGFLTGTEVIDGIIATGNLRAVGRISY